MKVIGEYWRILVSSLTGLECVHVIEASNCTNVVYLRRIDIVLIICSINMI